MKKYLASLIAITMIVATTINAQIPTNGLVAWYPFNGNANDSSGNGHDGTVNGATLTKDRFGKTNNAFHFNGKTDYITTVPGKTIGTNKLTISFWLKTTSKQMIDPISFSNASGSVHYSVDLNNPCSGVGIDGGSGVVMKGDSSILNNNWHHCLIIISGTVDATIYIDGILQSSITCSALNSKQSLNPTTTSPWTIGANEVASVRFFDGDLDDIAIYNRALSITEIDSLYHEGGYPSSFPTNGLVAWYPFTGNAIDSSGNGHDGTVNGATLTKDRFGNAKSAYSFNGISNYISLPNVAIQGTRAKSISFWVNTLATGMVVSTGTNTSANGGAFNLRVETNNFIGFMGGNYTVGGYDYALPTGSKIVNNNVWHHVVGTFSSSVLKIFVDGVLQGSATLNLSTNGQANFVGKSNDINAGNTAWFKGSVDDICIYNRALDTTEVQALYHQGGYGNPLPIKTTTISAKINVGAIAVNWHTSTELNTSHFIIQHSTDGSSFTDIGTVKAVGSGANGYQFTDNNPTNGINYYRLQSVDKDGASTFSMLVSVQLNIDNNKLVIYPNPARDVATVKGSHITSIEMLDNIGKLVKVVSLKDATNPTLSVSGLPAGVYHLRIHSTNGNVSGIGFIKQ